MADDAARVERVRTPDDGMSKEDKEAFIDKTQEFEGPDPREKKDEPEKHTEEPGVSHS